MRDADFKILKRRDVSNLRMHKASYVQGAQSPKHNHENARLVFVLRGNFSEIYAGKRRECSPFTTIFRPPNEEHSDDYYGKGIICLSVQILPAWLEYLNQHQVNLKDSVDFFGGALPSLISKLSQEFDAQDNISSLAIEALMLEIAVEISRRENKTLLKELIAPQWLSSARDFIHAEFAQNPSIAEIARAVDIHPVHLARVFRRQYKSTIADYIRILRIEAAKSELTSTDNSIADIALNTGFPDQSHFSKTFKRVVNITPGKYRKLMRAR